MSKNGECLPWLVPDTHQILRLRRSGVPFDEIAETLHRSEADVRAKHAELHQVDDFAAFWTRARLSQLGQMLSDEWPAIAIAEHLQCSQEAVVWAIPRFRDELANSRVEAGDRVRFEPSFDRYTTDWYARNDARFCAHMLALIEAGAVRKSAYGAPA
jgi:hypothetical protein